MVATVKRPFRYGAALLALVLLAACANVPPGAPKETAAAVGNISTFPLDAYDQNVDHWLKPDDPAYDQPIFTPAFQQARFAEFRARYFGTAAGDASPWNASFVEAVLANNGPRSIRMLGRRELARYGNDGKSAKRIGYGENFRPHTTAWLDDISRNMNLAQFDAPAQRHYQAARRAIATDNLLVRGLPTVDPHYYDFHLAGEGYPFDNLQITAIRPGTPLYILAQSADKAWLLVLTPDVIGWVGNDGVGRTDASFVEAWRAAAQRRLGAITVATVAVTDTNGVFHFKAPLGTVLPISRSGSQMLALVPMLDAERHAIIRQAALDADTFVPMPWLATPRHFAAILKTTIGHPYGWGNTYFYNDCSAETRSLFTPFGIWLPRHSSNQMEAGRLVDLSSASMSERLDYLKSHGHPLATLIYIPGHVMLYLGNATENSQTVPMTYQNIWGLRPADDSRRAVIGQAVIFPLLASYPEDTSLQSLADKRRFQVTFLDAPSAADRRTGRSADDSDATPPTTPDPDPQ